MNYNNKTEKHTNTWRLNNILLNNDGVNNQIKEEIRGYFKTNKNKNTITPNPWGTTKVVLRGKCIAL